MSCLSVNFNNVDTSTERGINFIYKSKNQVKQNEKRDRLRLRLREKALKKQGKWNEDEKKIIEHMREEIDASLATEGMKWGTMGQKEMLMKLVADGRVSEEKKNAIIKSIYNQAYRSCLMT